MHNIATAVAGRTKSALARYYRSCQRGVVRRWEPRFAIVQGLIPDNGVRILDVGCNDGYFSAILKKSGNTVVGLEINDQLAAQATKKIDKVVVQNVEVPWQVDSESFDIVHMGAILEHVFDYGHVLSEAHRVLVSGGTLIIVVPNLAYLLHRLQLLVGKMPAWYKNFDHIRGWTKGWLTAILREKGFKPVLWRGTFIVNVPILNWIARFLPTYSSLLVCVAEKFSLTHMV